MFLPEGEDPDSLVRKEGKKRSSVAAGSQPAIEYLFARLAEGLDVTSIDDQAHLASLAAPLIERVPDGILKQLMGKRLAVAHRSGPCRGRQPISGVSRLAVGPVGPGGRLHAGCQHCRDGCWAICCASRRCCMSFQPDPCGPLRLKDGLKDALAGRATNRICSSDIVSYIDKNPDVDLSEILGRWSGTADHATLLALLDQPAALAEGALQAEFSEGVDRYLGLRSRADRQKLLAEVRKEPSREKFAAFWTAKRAAAPRRRRG